jgi:Flp pilus assembly protein TadD
LFETVAGGLISTASNQLMPPTLQSNGPHRIPVWLPAGLLLLLTLAVFWPATRCDFINVDDQAYVTANPHVQAGLTLASVKWAFLNPVSANWHPLTMLSHMLDCQLYGLKPWGHHLTSVLLHALNAMLVFVWLQQLTGARWRSLLVAALFAVHPLRVESVAWVAERKDVLCAFFGLLTLICYSRYAGQFKIQNSKFKIFYSVALFFFALGLMSKPMLVTLPFVLLLVDYWPLGRIQNSKFKIQNCKWLVLEKIPFFALAVVMSVVTFMIQGKNGVVKTVEDYPPGARIGNLLISYCRYLGKIFWPSDLAVYYPHPGYWPLAQVLLAGGLLAGLTVFCVMRRRHQPYLLMGWLWFLGTLVPVIGLVQVGRQSMADRYSYLPSLGVLMLTVWGVHAAVRRWRYHPVLLAVMGTAAVVGCVATTRQQLEYWKNSGTLLQHTLAVTQDNWFAHKALGAFLLSQGQTDGAIRQFQAALRLNPDDAEACNNLGIAFLDQGQTGRAISQFQNAIRFKPDDAEAHHNLGNVLLGQGQTAGAIREFREAIRLKPDDAEARNNLGIALASTGRLDEAVRQFQAALRLKPEDTEVQTNLTRALKMKDSPAGR